jgi:hypothetical protein
MSNAYIVLPTGEWLSLCDSEMHYDVIKRSGFLDDFKETETDAYCFFKELGYADDDKISDEDEDAFDDIKFEYTQRAVAHALKKGVLRIRCYNAGEIIRSGKIILLAGDINRITETIIETAFVKFNVPNSTILSIENCEGKEIFKGTYSAYRKGACI